VGSLADAVEESCLEAAEHRNDNGDVSGAEAAGFRYGLEESTIEQPPHE
jgi:hypothetical protein